jgi:hypothetical protein
MEWWSDGVAEWWKSHQAVLSAWICIGFTERNFFVRTVAKYGIAMELQTKMLAFPVVAQFVEHMNGIQEGAIQRSKAAKAVNNFLKFLFPQARTLRAKGSENRDKEFLAGAGSEKTGRIRGTRTKANEYEH